MPDYATRHPGSTASSSTAGVDFKTLWITALASGAAAYACSQLWAPGTLAAAAFTPVLVAIIKEALAKSTEVVTRSVPVRGVVRSAPPPGPEPFDPLAPPTIVGGEYDPYASELPDAAADPQLRVPQVGEIAYATPRRRGGGWRLAIITGLLGFLVCAVIVTVPELVAGGSASGRDGTTLFGGKDSERTVPETKTETTTTPTQTVTLPPAKTVTVPAPTVTTPAPQTTTVPPQTTTVPPPTTTVPPGTQPGAPTVTQQPGG